MHCVVVTSALDSCTAVHRFAYRLLGALLGNLPWKLHLGSFNFGSLPIGNLLKSIVLPKGY